MDMIKTNLEFNSNKTLRNIADIKRIILHNSGVTVLQTIETIHNYHKNTRGYAGIGYHFYIRKDGTIYEGRPVEYVGAHARNNNSDSIGICFEGKFDEEIMPEVQLKAGQELVEYLKEQYNITKVQKHSDVCNTSCPGANFPFDEIANATKTNEIPKKVDNTYSHKDFVKDIQKAIGAKVDGIAGPETLSKTVTVSRYKNNRHAVVKPIQRYLNALGFNCGAVDGTAGKLFEQAVKSYQKANSCVQDGEITARNKTWKNLLKFA